MARTATLSELRTRILDLTDKRTQRFSSTVLNTLINQAICQFEDIVMQVDDTYNLTTGTINIVSGTADYSLPDNYYKLKGVEVYDGSKWINISPFEFKNRNDYQSTTGSVHNLRYMLYQNKLRIVPTPAFSTTNGLRVWYIPVHTALSGDSDTYNGVNGWEDYVVYAVAIKIRASEEEDPSIEAALLGEAEKRIKAAAEYRDHGNQPAVKNVNGVDGNYYDYFYPYYLWD